MTTTEAEVGYDNTLSAIQAMILAHGLGEAKVRASAQHKQVAAEIKAIADAGEQPTAYQAGEVICLSQFLRRHGYGFADPKAKAECQGLAMDKGEPGGRAPTEG